MLITNYLDVATLLLALSVAIMIVRGTNLFSILVTGSVFSVFCALNYLVMMAPDVALTEAAVGACATTCILLASLKFFPENTMPEGGKLLTALVILCLFIFLSYFAFDLHSYGDPEAITNKGAVEYYKQNTGKDIGLLSMVSAILASYRGFDTFGETLVIFTAGLSVLLILKPRTRKDIV